ncbi:unnamed protein product [Camellia sinensis]
MKEDYEIEEKKQAAADVLFHYSEFVMACIGNRVRPCDLRLHLMKNVLDLSLLSMLGDSPAMPMRLGEISGLPTSLKRESSQMAASPDAMGESSSSSTRLDKADSFRAL